MLIGTWNVDYAEKSHRADLLARITENPADIWVLTETHDDLKPPGDAHSLSTPQRDHAEAPGKVIDGSRWVTIWSRYRVTDLPDFTPMDPSRTVVAGIHLSESDSDPEIVVYGTVLPERGQVKHAAAIREQSQEWQRLRHAYPKAMICVAGDFNTDMRRARDYGLPSFFGPKKSTRFLMKSLRALGMRTVTDHGFPEGLKPKYPPIDHIALSDPHADQARIGSTWAGRKGNGQKVGDRVGVVIDVD